MTTQRHTIECEKGGCNTEALISRLPMQKTSQFIHLWCWEHITAFYAYSEAHLATSALAEYWNQSESKEGNDGRQQASEEDQHDAGGVS